MGFWDSLGDLLSVVGDIAYEVEKVQRMREEYMAKSDAALEADWKELKARREVLKQVMDERYLDTD